MSDLDLLKRYLQDKIDIGIHKMFAFDKDDNFIEFKTIDALNEVNNLQSQLQQKENILKEVREYIGISEEDRNLYDIYDVNGIEILEILDKEKV